MARAQIQVRPGTPVAQIALTERLAFVKRVYGWMTAALLMSVVGAAIAVKSGIALSLLQSGFLGSILLIVGWIFLGHIAMKVRHVPTWNVMAFAGYALFTGIVISTIVYVAMVFGEVRTGSAGTYVYMALGGTVVTFATLSVYAMTTKKDFSFLGGMLMVGLVVLIAGGVVNMFVQSSTLGIIMAGIGVMIFSGYILHDTQKILRTYPSNEHVAASMTLFLDFVMLFMELLRLILYIGAVGDD